MAAPLSPGRLQSARRDFGKFNFLNSFSFIFVAGSFITLFAIRLGASKAIVGVLNAIAYSTYFFMPIGKQLVRKKPIVWVFGWGWTARYAALLPILFSPLLAARGHSGAAIGLLVAGTAGFSIFRGIALIGNNPVVGFLASGGGEKPRSDRGEFIVNTSIVNSVASMLSGFVLAMVLGEKATPWGYAAGLGVGIAIGFAGCVFLLKVPEPTDYQPDMKSSLLATTREAMKDSSFRNFVVIFMLLAFISGMGRSFLPVYAKEVFSQGDDAVMLYALLASVGSVVMGLLTRLVVDRLGSKPLLIIYSGIGLLSFLPIALIPGGKSYFASSAVTAVFLAFIHFLSSFGFAGEENAAQTYYFSLVPREKTLDLSVAYFFAYGLGGAIGSGIGGLLLDLLEKLGLGPMNTYRALYLFLCVLLGIVTYSMRRLKRLGSASVSQSLGMMFSLRDLKTFDLLSRLDRSANSKEEVRIIHELGHSGTSYSQAELVHYLSSPRFEVRMEVLLALESMPQISRQVAHALVREVEAHTFTTAYVAARILGRLGRSESVPVLRKAAEADDYLLQGTALIALAKSDDRESIPLVESVLMSTKNPRVKISAAVALEIMHSESSLAILASSLKFDDPPAFVSDEIILAMASILGILEDFYPLYGVFLQDERHALALLESSAAEIIVDERTLSDWKDAVDRLFSPEPAGDLMASFIVRTGMSRQGEIVLSEALMDPKLGYRGMRLLAACYPLFVRRTKLNAPPDDMGRKRPVWDTGQIRL